MSYGKLSSKLQIQDYNKYMYVLVSVRSKNCIEEKTEYNVMFVVRVRCGPIEYSLFYGHTKAVRTVFLSICRKIVNPFPAYMVRQFHLNHDHRG